MSQTDSFIEEVTEEVRRDKLFRLMRKYGWIAIVLVVAIVAGASYNEWRKARDQAEARAFGDALLGAMQNHEAKDRAARLATISAEGDKGAVVALLLAAEAASSGDPDTAVSALQALAADPQVSEEYRQLAQLKLVLLQADGLDPAERLARLQPLAAPGAPFRLLAEEQMAIAEIDSGNAAAAIERLQALLADQEATPGLRRRVSQLIVALGGELEPA